MDESPFNKLPAEMRNRIYEYVLEDEIVITDEEPAPEIDSEDISRRLALTATCKQIRQEALPIFYNSCFVLNTNILDEYPNDAGIPYADAHIDFLFDWVKAMGSHAKYLRMVKVRCDAWCTADHGDDALIHDLPKCISEMQRALAGTDARLELRFCLDWGPRNECRLAISVMPSDLSASRKNFEAAWQEEQIRLEKAAKDENDRANEQSYYEVLRQELQCTRRVIREFFDVLDATDFAT